jgi:phage N-6-adenine-methyltransferase
VVEPIAESIGGFDLDPCSGAEASPFAAECYTEADDGLEQPWNGDVWVNPPYSGVESWAETAADEVRRGSAERVVFLCKGDSSTQWWQTALREAALVCAIEGRLSFGDGDNSAPFPSHIFVFGQGSALSDSLIHALDGLGALLVEQWSSRGGS